MEIFCSSNDPFFKKTMRNDSNEEVINYFYMTGFEIKSKFK